MKKISILVVVILTMLLLVACNSDDDFKDVSEKTDKSGFTSRQIDGPQKGDTVATFHIKGYGDFSVVLFPEAAPKAVENFVTHAKEGYYDGVTFHRVIEDFMIQGGDPTGTGMYGESIWGEEFEDEFSESFLPLRGALCMANAGADTNGSQFFIVTLGDCYEDYLTGFSEEQEARFREYGGTPWLYQAHTVFGQVYEGMDVVDAISETDTDSSDKPVEDVVIESITVFEYE